MGEPPRREAGYAVKNAAQLRGGGAQLRGDGPEADRVFFARATEELRGLLHERDRFELFLGSAATARPVAIFFRFLCGAKKDRVLPERPARRAGWPAVN